MAFELGDHDNSGMNEMNLIPLIDIMLVLMIIFLVTATVLNPSVPLDLPKTSASVNDAPPEVLQISIDEAGGIYWDREALSVLIKRVNTIPSHRFWLRHQKRDWAKSLLSANRWI
ncbi:Biopolymer transport protein ExbD/TolR [Moraxella catarrhalis]|nr:Biopolymer transport protein ExbD/TolR [Moraxella catarrhalis]